MTDDEIIKEARRAKLPRYMYDSPSARQALARFAANQIPTNWFDPLLTGEGAVLKGYEYGPPDVERLLLALRNRCLPQEQSR